MQIKIKKNIIILGTSRSGKTNLAVKMAKKLNYSIISTDPIVTAFEKTFPSLNINHDNRDGQSVNNLEEYLLNYMKSTGGSSKALKGLNYIYEGAYFNLQTLLKKEIQEKYIIIALCCTYDSPSEYYKQIRKHDFVDDWTKYVSDDELQVYCENIYKNNIYIKNFCQEHKITFFETSLHREKVFKKIIKYAKKRVHKEKITKFYN